MTTGIVDPFHRAADLLAPEAWQPRDRPPLEPHQIPPSEPFDLWLLQAGRGAGKTEACARYFAKYMREHPGARGRIIAPTFGDAVESCVKGPSGLMSIDPEIRWLPSAPGGAKVIWPNGSEALVIGTPFPRDVDRLRAGGNRDIDWWEEMAANTQLGKPDDEQGAWNQAQLGLRRGPHPHSIGSTTPRSTVAFRGILAQPNVIVTSATIDDNPHNNPEWVKKMKDRHEGTRLGRQELLGELIDDVEGAFWKRSTLEECRVDDFPDLAVVVTAVDPAATSGPKADDTGIVVAGTSIESGEGFILADETCHLGPEGWGLKAITAHHEFTGDRIVGEVNNGGEMVAATIRAIDPTVPFKPVHASRGKATRAEPVAALFGGESDRPSKVHLVGGFPELEDQLCTWVPGEEKSPDRLDAMVWAITDLMLGKQSSWRPLK